jgi:putative ABC transport system substrate-binding protein
VLERVAQDRIDELPSLAATLVAASVQAICAVSPPGVQAARGATGTIPIIVVDLESDPVANGWAASLARPGGNLTGVFLDLPDFTAKCVQLLREAVPGMGKLALLWHPASGSLQLAAARKAAASIGLAIQVFEVSSVAEFEPAFRAMAAGGASGLLMLSAPLFSGNPKELVDLVRAHRLPAMNQFPDFAEKGGLLAYGPDVQSMFRQVGAMTRRILQGAAAGGLPIERPVRFRLVVNLKAAAALGATLPPTLLARADEVIE